MENAIKAIGIVKKYDEINVLDGVDLELQRGKIYGIIGKSGAGKTTFLRILVNMIMKNEGELYVFNEKIEMDSYSYLANIGYFIGSEFHDWMTIRENLELHCQYYGFYNFEEIDKYLDIFQLKDYENKKIKDLSMGMVQKAAIIRALVTKPKLLILDEPFNFIDYETIILVRKIMKDLSEKFGTTIIVTSHIIKELEEIIDEAIFLEKGVIKDKITMSLIKSKVNKRHIIKCEEVHRAVKILEEKLGIRKFVVRKDGEILIKEYCSVADISKIFIENNINLLEIYSVEMSLEEYITENE